VRPGPRSDEALPERGAARDVPQACLDRRARLHGRIEDVGRDALHRVSAARVGQACILVLEDLNVKVLARRAHCRGFRRAMGDVALGELRRQIRDTPAWAARQVSEIDRRHPSSPRGFEFGTMNTALSSAKR